MMKKITLLLFALATTISFAQVNYNANGGTSFGGVIGNSTMSISDDGTTISITIDRAGDFDGNDMVIYVDNGSPGRTVIDGTVNDANDDGRRITSAIGAGDLTFPPGFEATHAIYGDQNFMGIYAIPSTGNINGGDLVYYGGPGIGNASTDPFTLTFTKADINIASGDPINFSFVASYANPNDNGSIFRSNEGYGDGILNGGNQNSNAAVTFTTYFNYPSGDKYGVATTANIGFWNQDSTWTNGNPPSPNDQITINHNLSINQDVTIENSLTGSNGTIIGVEGANILTLNGDLTVAPLCDFGFNSDATGSAQFLNGPSATITGEVGVARFIPTGSTSPRKAYRFISSSVDATQPIYENWQTGGMSLPGIGIHITGSQTGANGFDQTVTGNPSLLQYDLDPNDNTYKWGFVDNTNAKTFTVGEAYNVYVRGDRNYDLTGDAAPNVDVRIPSRGSLRLSNSVFLNPLNPNASGFSFVGNPYQATVDWTTITKNNINPNFIYLWDPAAGSEGAYQTIDFSGGLLPSERYIQPGQAFFVTTMAAGASSLEFKVSDKNPSQNAVGTFSTPNNRPIIEITLMKEFQGAATVYDRLKINLDGDNAVDFNDAVKAINFEENLSVNSNGTLLSIENKAMPVNNESIQLHLTGITSTDYFIDLDLNNLDPAYNVVFHDNFLNVDTILANGANNLTVNFDLNDTASTDANRFELRFTNTTLSSQQANNLSFEMFPNPVNNKQVTIKGLFNASNASVSFYNTLGQQVLNKNIESNESIITLNNMDAGIYLVKVTSGEKSITKKLVIK